MLRPDFQAINEAAADNHLHFHALYQMDELMEKLKLLHYERHLLRDMKMKPLSRFYFVRAVNSGEQFFMFTSLCAWLIRKTGRGFEQPQEFHDPSKTVADIVKVLQEMVCGANCFVLSIKFIFNIFFFFFCRTLRRIFPQTS